MRKATLIYNPLAGPANLAAIITLVADVWYARGWQVRIEATNAAGHATRLAQDAVVRGCKVVLAAGGDGTLGEIANGLAGSKTILAPLPAGTSNSFARELQIPRPTLFDQERLLRAAEALLEGRVQRIDLGHIRDGDGNERCWLLWAGAGLDSWLVDRLEPRPKWSKRLGPLGYLLHGLVIAPQFPRSQSRISIDGHPFHGPFAQIVVSNCRLYAGGQLLLSPQATLDDGLLDVWLFRTNSLTGVAGQAVRIRLGKHQSDSNIFHMQARSISIESDPPLPCQTDGDRAGSTPVRCEVRPGNLLLLVPEHAPIELFSRPGCSFHSENHHGPGRSARP